MRVTIPAAKLNRALSDLCHVMAKYLSSCRLSELVKCLLFLFLFSSGGGGGVGGGTDSRVCRPLFLVSVSLRLSARFGHQLSSSSLRRMTEFVRMPFYFPFPFPSPVNVCFHSYRVSIPEQHWSRVFCLGREGGGGGKPAGPSRQVCRNAAFSPQVETRNLCEQRRWPRETRRENRK